VEYRNLADAVDFYVDRGYVYVPEAPWHVGMDAYYVTKPEGRCTDIHYFENRHGAVSFPSKGQDNRYLVASGEQSFIQMLLDGSDLKKHVCVTPCFRADRHDAWHQPWFMKAELINAQDTDEGHLVAMVHDAAAFFEQFFSIRVVKTARSDLGEPAYDIIEKGTRAELGSYGIRDRLIRGKSYRWIYGTGCAEPRLSTAIMRQNKTVGR
jgi:hypothetical protein